MKQKNEKKNVNKTKERLKNDEITLNDGLHGKSLFLCFNFFLLFFFVFHVVFIRRVDKLKSALTLTF